jgi:hypothetical protein
LGATNAAAIAGHYGSISAVTFAAVTGMLTQLSVPYDGYLVAVAAAMERPAIFANGARCRPHRALSIMDPSLGILNGVWVSPYRHREVRDRSKAKSQSVCATSVLHRWSQPVDATLYLKGEMECTVMGQRFHRGFTAAEKTELWDRWKRGESLKAIGRAFGKPSSSIFFLVAPHGWDSSCRAAALQAGIDDRGARGDFQRYFGTSIGAIDGQVAWPPTLDGKSGNEPKWWL